MTNTKTGKGAKLPPTGCLRWADWDPSYTGNNRLSVYDTKDEQRGNRPDLAGFPVAVIRFKSTKEAKRFLALNGHANL